MQSNLRICSRTCTFSLFVNNSFAIFNNRFIRHKITSLFSSCTEKMLKFKNGFPIISCQRAIFSSKSHSFSNNAITFSLTSSSNFSRFSHSSIVTQSLKKGRRFIKSCIYSFPACPSTANQPDAKHSINRSSSRIISCLSSSHILFKVLTNCPIG